MNHRKLRTSLQKALFHSLLVELSVSYVLCYPLHCLTHHQLLFCSPETNTTRTRIGRSKSAVVNKNGCCSLKAQASCPIHPSTNCTTMEDALSPTSVLRLNFDSLLAETTDPVPNEDEKGASAAALWDAVSTTLPDCVRTHRVVSWIEEGLHSQPVFFNEVLCIRKVEFDFHK